MTFGTIMRKVLLFWCLGVFWFSSQIQAYEEIAVNNGGTVRGFVRLEGERPRPEPVDIFKFKEFCKEVPNEAIVIGPRRGVRYAVVTLEGISKGKALEREAVYELDNRECRFVPHVQVAGIGQILLLRNNDPILHTAHAFFGKQPHFNAGLYPGKVVRKSLVSIGVTKVICEVHPWMSAYIVVTDHPYSAVSDGYGEYEIRDIPPGKYKLKVWHEILEAREIEVEVKAKDVSNADFLLRLSR